MDGNFDITQKSDFNTVSWCTFSYTERAYMHQNTNLVGSSDSEAVGFLNTTYAFNNWSKGCKARMPMARVGKIHMLNNYYDCTGNGSNAINPRKNSEFLIEGNYFEKNVKYYGQNGATAVTWSATNHIEGSSIQPSNVGSTVTVPYDYTEAPVNTVPEMVKTNAGATLTFQESAIEDIPVQRRASDSYTYNIMGQRVSNDTRGIVIKNGKKYFQR
jgi:pectate lyase